MAAVGMGMLAVNAQTAGSGVSGSATVSSGATVSSPIDPGFIQFNELVVESVSGATAPAEILATNPNIYTIMGGGVSGENSVSSGGVGTMMKAPSAPGTCYKFDSANGTNKYTIPCPVPPSASGSSGGTVSPTIYPAPPFRYQPYRIEVDSATRLLLRDRSAASLRDFTSGDQINVFGYYNPDGSIQAYLVRDLSKPVQNEFFQLNAVELVSISTGTTPTTLVVVQNSGPCFGYGPTGATRQSIACPMGLRSSAQSPALRDIQIPSALMPDWGMLRKYVIQLDAQTILLDNNRTRLSLSELQIGDSLNVYGDSSDNGATINADIVRDLSVPPAIASYNGTVTQVNADGSFVVQTKDGWAMTVQSPVVVGAKIQVSGILDRLQKVLSKVQSISTIGDLYPPLPMPVPLGAPNTRN